MRILVISNFYPPHYLGGYELGCHDVVNGLRQRGHEVIVLTSTYGMPKPHVEGHIYYQLAVDLSSARSGFFPRALIELARKELANRHVFVSLCRSFRPDLVYAWNVMFLFGSTTLLPLAQKMGIPVAIFVFDHRLFTWERAEPWRSFWMRQLQKPGRWLLKAGLRRLVYTLDDMLGKDLYSFHLQFASQFLKREALRRKKESVEFSPVIYFGIDPQQFPFREEYRPAQRLLYVGQLLAIKGVHTAIEALDLLVHRYEQKQLSLTIVGGGIDSAYPASLRELIGQRRIEDHVTFLGMVTRTHQPEIYRKHDILLFPSVWEEPFGIVPIEAMASGLVPVATASGGSAEIFEDEHNSLIFPREDAEMCAAQIMRLVKDERFYESLRLNARKTVQERFQLDRTVNEIESHLCQIITRASP